MARGLLSAVTGRQRHWMSKGLLNRYATKGA